MMVYDDSEMTQDEIRLIPGVCVYVRRNSPHSAQHLVGIAYMSVAAKWPMKNELQIGQATISPITCPCASVSSVGDALLDAAAGEPG
jgi:hypothetical protein